MYALSFCLTGILYSLGSPEENIQGSLKHSFMDQMLFWLRQCLKPWKELLISGIVFDMLITSVGVMF